MVLQKRVSFCIFCSKTIKEKHDKIDQTDCILKTKVGKGEYEEIRKKKTIPSKETEKKILHHRKFRKYNNNLKHKPEPTVITS